MPLDKDPKELFEHKLVVEDLTQKLKNWGVCQLSQTEVVEFPYLYHLRTWLTVQVSSVSAVDLIKKLHPTAALGVAPRNYGISWMKDLPNQNSRKRFGAPLLFQISSTHQVCLVGIRNLEWDQSSSSVTSGCGVVSISDLQREWEELTEKRQFAFKNLSIWE
jgi:menaquinone-specific isochorismate synthase